MCFFFELALLATVAFFSVDTNRLSVLSLDANTENIHTKHKQQDTTGLIATGAVLQRISNQFHFTEGAAVDKRGNIFFTDQPADAIWKYGTDGTLSLFLHKTGRSNGLYLDKADNIIACADEKNRVLRISPDKKKTVLYKARKSKRLNGPNDLWVDAKGGIYITDPYYQRPYWKRKGPALKSQKVYYLPQGEKRLQAVEESIRQPNGIVGTPDNQWLFIADIGDSKIYKYEIQPDGTLKNRQVFIERGSDGLTLDNRGNLYITGDGVTVYNKDGKRIEHIDVPEKWTSNVCFGGSKKDQLFITASGSVYVLQMNVTGVE